MAAPVHKAPHNPSKAVAIGFAVAIAVGTAALMLPAATTGDGGASLRVASFTATSAICVTGLTVVDTATYWTPFGQFLIMALIQIGGLGIMTGASLLFLAVSRRIGLRNRMIARQERGSIDLGDVRRVLFGVVAFSLLMEIVIAAILSTRFWLRDDTSFATSVWRGAFHAVSSFNNAGFALFSDNMIGYALDPTIMLTLTAAVVLGGLGFPVWIEVQRRARSASRWSLHTKLTLVMTAALLGAGWVLLTVLEWNNPETLGSMPTHNKLVSGLFASAMPRTAGFNAVDYEQMGHPGLMVTDMLMFAGGGSGSTAGGIKVTTFAVLVIAASAEFRASPDVSAFGRRISNSVQRQALTIAFASINVVVIGALLLMVLSPFGFTESIFESISAFATVGLSMNVTPELSGAADAVLIGLMYLGRVGPLTLAVALLLRRHPRRYRFPEERPLVG